MKNFFLISALLTTLFLQALTASTVPFRFRHITVEDGLASNTVRSIWQNDRGIMWFGTSQGLCSFDGINIKLYPIVTDEEPSGSNKYVYAMMLDKNGLLWVGTDEGVYKYDYEKNEFKFFDRETENGERIENIVNNMAEDKDGNIWFSSFELGVYRYSPGSGRLKRFPMEAFQGRVDYVFVDSDNAVWLCSTAARSTLWRLDRAEDEFKVFPFRLLDGPADFQAVVMTEDVKGTLWLGLWRGGLLSLDKHSGIVRRHLHSNVPAGSLVHIHSLNEIEPNQLLIGSDEGLMWYNTLSSEYKLYLPKATDATSISNKFVYPIFKDKEGGLWIGTYYGGINYVSPNNGQIESYACRAGKMEEAKIISFFCEDKNSNIWIATDDDGLFKYEPGSEKFMQYLPERNRNSISYHNVHALCPDGDKLWIGTYTGGLNVLNLKTGRFSYYNHVVDDSTTIDGSSVYSIFKDREGRIWVTSMRGVNRYNPAKDNFIRVRELGCLTFDIDQDKEGRIWFATESEGIFCHNPADNSWKNYRRSDAPGSLGSNTVNSIYIDKNNKIYLGTGNGVYCFDAEKESFYPLDLNLPSKNVCCIIGYEEELWITTSGGLVHYTSGGKSTTYTTRDGLRSEHFLPNSGLLASDGKIYIGSVNGFNAFYPYKIQRNAYVPPVVITGLLVNNQALADEGISPQYTRKIKLTHKENMLSFLYASLSYSSPESNQYAFMMEGLDRDWNFVGNQTKATYTNLAPGDYLFKVKGSNNNGIWNEKPSTIMLTISPPLLLSPGFKILYFALILLILTLIISNIVRISERNHQRLMEKLSIEKEKEVHNAKIQFFTTIAHEIRNPVSLIIAPLDRILKIPELNSGGLGEDLKMIHRNSQRLLFLVNQLLDFRKIEQGGSPTIHKAKHNLGKLLDDVSQRFRSLIEQEGKRFEYKFDEQNFETCFDYEALTKVLSNLLSNAVKYTKDYILLSARVDRDKEIIEILVQDNGCGIDPDEQERVFAPFYQAKDPMPGTGIGLSIVKSMVEAHNGTIRLESEPGRGCSFYIELPFCELDEKAPQAVATSVVLPQDIVSESSGEDHVSDVATILLVEDNREMLHFLSERLSEDYRVLMAREGEEGLDMLRANDVQLIVSDWMMPGMDGIEFCRKVREDQFTSHIPFVLLTAKTDIDSKLHGLDCGADAYVEKPFSMGYLKATVRNLLELRRMLIQKFSKMPLVHLSSIAGNTVEQEFLLRMNQLIEENFANPELSVDFLAKEMCISRSRLFAKIKTLIDVTPNELIQIVRLKKAAALLLEQRYMVGEVAYMVGFNNPSYFSKCFQKQFGMKPFEFVTSHRNKQNTEGSGPVA